MADDIGVQTILGSADETPTASVQERANAYGIPASTVRRYLKRFFYHPYKLHHVQKLNEADRPLRLDFCHWALQCTLIDEAFTDKIIFSDECLFDDKGNPNRQNCRFWSQTNPHQIVETRYQGGRKLMVWAGVVGDRILGPHFFDSTVSGHSFLQMLEGKIIPEIEAIPGNENFIFLLDGAPGHYARSVRQLLNERFPGKWIGRGAEEAGLKNWPPRSPDLTILDFFVWGYVKSKLPVPIPPEADLRQLIFDAFATITPEMLRNARLEWEHRLHLCIAEEGGHFEHLI